MIDRLGRQVGSPPLHAAVTAAFVLIKAAVIATALFLHGRPWGPFPLTFVHQASDVLGRIPWVREERAARDEPISRLLAG